MYQAISSVASTSELVLLTIMLHGPQYGAKIVEFIEEASESEHIINCGTLYPMLRNLERDGLISSCQLPEENIESRQGRKRKYYEITDKGRRLLYAANKTRQQLIPSDFEWNLC